MTFFNVRPTGLGPGLEKWEDSRQERLCLEMEIGFSRCIPGFTACFQKVL